MVYRELIHPPYLVEAVLLAEVGADDEVDVGVGELTGGCDRSGGAAVDFDRERGETGGAGKNAVKYLIGCLSVWTCHFKWLLTRVPRVFQSNQVCIWRVRNSRTKRLVQAYDNNNLLQDFAHFLLPFGLIHFVVVPRLSSCVISACAIIFQLLLQKIRIA